MNTCLTSNKLLTKICLKPNQIKSVSFVSKPICLEYDLNKLQVLAILSFDHREHILGQNQIVDNIEKKLNTMAINGWFNTEEDQEETKAEDDESKHDEEKKVTFKIQTKKRGPLSDKNRILKRRNLIPDWNSPEMREEKKDFILALSIILSNLCRDEDYAFELLSEENRNTGYDNKKSIAIFLPKFLNLLKHDPKHPYISEQISILLANLSNSNNFN